MIRPARHLFFAHEIVDVKVEGLMAQVILSVGDQHLTSIITAAAAEEYSKRCSP